MKSVIIIPARYASTRFPGKPLALLAGEPMILHVVGKALKASKDVYVATDDERIFKTVETAGMRAIMTSATHRSGTDRCYEALTKICRETGETFDVVVNIQGDEPFVQPEQINQLIDCFYDSEIQIATLAKQITSEDELWDVNKVKVVFSNKKEALYFSRASIPYVRGMEKSEWLSKGVGHYKHLGMYAYRSSVLKEITALPESSLEKAESLEQLRWLESGYRIAVRTTEHESIGIDTPEDLERANNFLKLS
ncbi:MAG: 3-deoxy-manno-octulosonate cytidylyltransferase [Culturomica sp.]|jgi:3-deoxy-manno-octulosonate cytidylyltransferase (CMP-KDO synthetase)|nr:3-deoxy-manno-octulosonate cytidylyltransferase [Culturomica sp.]